MVIINDLERLPLLMVNDEKGAEEIAKRNEENTLISLCRKHRKNVAVFKFLGCCKRKVEKMSRDRISVLAWFRHKVIFFVCMNQHLIRVELSHLGKTHLHLGL